MSNRALIRSACFAIDLNLSSKLSEYLSNRKPIQNFDTKRVIMIYIIHLE